MQQLPKGVMSPTSGDPAPIQSWATASLQSVDELLPYRWDNAVDMNATVPTEPAQYGFRTDEGMRMYRWDAVNSEWVPAALTPADQNFFRFETKAEMDLWVGQPGQKAVVWGDSTPANNADYVWENGVWRPAKLFIQRERSTSQSIAGFTTVEVALDAPTYNVGFETVGNRIRVLYSGFYKLNASILFRGSISGSLYAQLYTQRWIGGVTADNLAMGEGFMNATASPRVEISQIVYFDAQDTYSMTARHSNGSALNLSSNNAARSIMSMEKID